MITIMKKKYIIPVLHITTVNCEAIIATSTLDVKRGTSVSEQYVKRDRSSYSVWDEDWQNP